MTARKPGMTITCQQVVDVVTDYLEGAMEPGLRREFEAHLALCPGCAEYLTQMRTTIKTLGHVPSETLPAHARADLLDTFRDLFPKEP
jgi:anti-sigma factor RsiW